MAEKKSKNDPEPPTETAVTPEVSTALRGYFGPNPTRSDLAKWIELYFGEAKRVRSSALTAAWTQSLLTGARHDGLDAEVAALRKAVEKAMSGALAEEASGKEKQSRIDELERALTELHEKEALSHLLSRVGDLAQRRLLDDDKFRSEFTKDAPRDAFVLSIDIRRSTELMLKAREPRLFAEFIVTLATQMRRVIIDGGGIFDKFTGDGILAFFPQFFSGSDAGYSCVAAAERCHAVFERVYREHRRCFVSVLQDTGLGIGIDWGAVQLVQLGGDFTAVGAPVVYACRMSGCTAGETLVNEPAFEQLFGSFSEYMDFEEVEIDVKREGKLLAHRVKVNGKTYVHRAPDWVGQTVLA